ncbi:MAG: hypothetical protein FWG26_01185 [Betaproteobacteria bacterium]|nr:hypothetical protein [Betaproteobacteria bacterium]
MTKQEKRKGGVSKLARTETVTIRLDSRLRYLTGLASRVQRRTVSSFIEWAIQESLSLVSVCSAGGGKRPIAEIADKLWDVNEADRFMKLAFHCPDLLTHNEQVLWKELQEVDYLWEGEVIEGKKVWKLEETSFDMKRARSEWKTLRHLPEIRVIRERILDDNGIPSRPMPLVWFEAQDDGGYHYHFEVGCGRLLEDRSPEISKDAYVTVDQFGIRHVSEAKASEESMPVTEFLDLDIAPKALPGTIRLIFKRSKSSVGDGNNGPTDDKQIEQSS